MGGVHGRRIWDYDVALESWGNPRSPRDQLEIFRRTRDEVEEG